jgi:hypothetical protein
VPRRKVIYSETKIDLLRPSFNDPS